MSDWLTATGEGIRIAVRLVPRASRNSVEGVLGDCLKIRLQAPPVDGKANEALVRFLAEILDVSRGSVRITAGLTGRTKQVEVTGIAAEPARAKLGVALSA